MAIKYLIPIDLNQNEIRNPVAHLLGSDPGSPTEGQFWYNSTGHTLKLRLAASTVDLQNPSLLNSQNGAYYLSRANHTGTQLAGTISDFDIQVHTSRLDQMAAPTADVSMNSHKLTNLTDPASAQDAATKNYVDITVQGLQPKPSATWATTAALAAYTYSNGSSGVGATLTGNANNTQTTVDGGTYAVGDLILVKDEAGGNAKYNGLYTVTQVPDASHPFIFTRHVDMDQSTEFAGGFIPVESGGTANKNTLWLCQATASITVGTTSVTFTQLNAATTYTFNPPLSLSGSAVSLNLNPRLVNNSGNLDLQSGVVSASTYKSVTVDTYGRVTAGTNPTTLAGYGITDAVKKYSATIGDGSATSIDVTQATHGLASNGQMIVEAFDASSGAEVICDVTINNSNGTVTFAFTTAPATNAIRIVIMG